MELLIDAHYREFCVRLLFNYTKRNPIQQYLQSHALIAQVVIQVISPVIDVNFSKADQYSFWLYSCILEDVLPVGYYSLMVEPSILSEVLQSLFYILDKQTYACLSHITKTFFMRQFLCLFQEMKIEIRLAIMDMLLLLGSGCMTSTITCPEPVAVSEEHPLCRTSQLLVAIALTMLR